MPGVLRNDRRSAALFFLGYASITTTLDLFRHLQPGEMDRHADRLNDAAADLCVSSSAVIRVVLE